GLGLSRGDGEVDLAHAVEEPGGLAGAVVEHLAVDRVAGGRHGGVGLAGGGGRLVRLIGPRGQGQGDDQGQAGTEVTHRAGSGGWKGGRAGTPFAFRWRGQDRGRRGGTGRLP